MVVVGVLMLRGRGDTGNPGAECNREKAPKVLGYGLSTGLFSGFFGIGGGFLIVPGLIGSTGMPILNAVGTSLIAVTAFGLTTAANYAFSGLVDDGNVKKVDAPCVLALAFVATRISKNIPGQ